MFVFIRMELEGFGPVGLFDFVYSCRCIHTYDIVVGVLLDHSLLKVEL